MEAPLQEDIILPLALDGVCYAVGGKALIGGISLAIDAGRISMLLGANGAGKSLFLRLCHGLLQPTAGAVRWQGPGAAMAQGRQAMVFQKPVMLRRSARANLAYALAAAGIPAHARTPLIDDMLERTGLGALADRHARVLSGGEQQRLALARAWIVAPQVLFLDEPTANLDPQATKAVEEIIAAVHATGTKIVMTTHDLGQARRLGDEVLFMHQGRIIERRASREFFAAPETPEALAYVEGRLP